MARRKAKTNTFLIVSLIVVVAAIFLLNLVPSDESPLVDLSDQFLECLPEDLTEAQKNEVHGILLLFDRRHNEGKVTGEDFDQLIVQLNSYIGAGRIDRPELNRFMVRVSHLTWRLDPDYNQPGTEHPLLRESPPDTTAP